MKVTLDHNCLVALEKNDPNAPYINELIAMHNDKKITIRVVGIGASELLPTKTYATNFNEFKQKLANVGLEHVEILPPIAYLDITFLDRCLLADEPMIGLEQKIHEVLFPTIEFDFSAYCESNGLDPNNGVIARRWRNAKCDVLAMWCHITFEGDIFVTSDRNFLRKKQELISLGANDILSPEEAASKVKVALAEHI